MYCAYVTKIRNLRKHTNADRLLCGECFGNTVIVDLGTEPDQLGVYFPVDGKLGVEFAQKNDLLPVRSTFPSATEVVEVRAAEAVSARSLIRFLHSSWSTLTQSSLPTTCLLSVLATWWKSR